MNIKLFFISDFNFFSELQGACALGQLPKLDSLLHDMRKHKKSMKEKLAKFLENYRISFRYENDENGDTAVGLVMFMPSSEIAEKVKKIKKLN